MPLLADRVQETTTTVGTGVLTLLGASPSFQSFTGAFGNGVSVYYVIAGGSEFEVGIGTTGAGTLSRDTVLRSTNANALVVLSLGIKEVFCAYVADRAVTTSDAATLTNKTISGVSNTLSNIANASTTAVSANTANTIVLRDASNNFSAGTVTAALTGNASTATALQTARTINGVTFNGTANITVTAATANALTLGSGLTGTSFTGGAAVTATVDATDASTASKVVSRNASGSSALKSLRLDGTTSGTITVQGAAAAGTYALTLPNSGGTNGHVLTTNGSGVTSWAAVTGPAVNQQTFNSSGTYTKPSTGSMVLIEVWGGGGGGSNSTTTGGAGGAGGSYMYRIVPLSAIAASASITIGAGGIGAAANTNNTGGAGNVSTFSGTVIVTGAGTNSGQNNFTSVPVPANTNGGGIFLFNLATSGAASTLQVAQMATVDGRFSGGYGQVGGLAVFTISSVYGGGGGASQTGGAAGISVYGGAGGGTGANGTAPAGGGGSGNNALKAGNGAAGRVIITVW